MKVELTYPPNIDDIDKVFHVKDKPDVLYAFGFTIFNPSKVDIPEHLMAHESLHGERQSVVSPEFWWDKYLKDIDFRYAEELLAHQREYQVWCAMAKSRNERRLGLKVMSKRLSSDLYGNMCKQEKAKQEIKNAP